MTSSTTNTWLWEWAKAERVASWQGHPGPATQPRAVFSPDGRRLALSDYEPGRIHIREVPTGKLLFALPGPATKSTAFSGDGKTLAAGGGFGGSSTLWHLPTRREIMSFNDTRAMCFCPADRTMVSILLDQVYLTSLPKLAEVDAGQDQVPRSLEEALNPRPESALEYSGKSGQPTRDHGVSPTVRNLLWRGRVDCGGRSWKWAAEWFAKALKDPEFEWRSTAKSDPEAVAWMPVAFVRAGNAPGYEALCRSLFESVDQSPNPAGAARDAAVACLLAAEPSPQLLSQVEYLLHSVYSVAPSAQWEPRYNLLRGIFEYRRGYVTAAMEWLDKAAIGHDVWCKATALPFQAMCVKRLGRGRKPTNSGSKRGQKSLSWLRESRHLRMAPTWRYSVWRWRKPRRFWKRPRLSKHPAQQRRMRLRRSRHAEWRAGLWRRDDPRQQQDTSFDKIGGRIARL